MFGFKKSTANPTKDSSEQARPGFLAKLRAKLKRGHS